MIQYSGGRCSLCGSENTSMVSCPLNPKSTHPIPSKHPLAMKSVAKPTISTRPTIQVKEQKVQYTEKRRAPPPKPPKPQSVLSSQKMHISELICGRFRASGCYTLSGKIAKSLIRIAATRIFNDPAQSLLEIVVNSIDAYKVKRGLPMTGKFGMGFFSILYWVYQNNNNSIELDSITETEKWTAKLHIENGELICTFKTLAKLSTDTPGLKVTINAPNLDDSHLLKLRFSESCKLYIDDVLLRINKVQGNFGLLNWYSDSTDIVYIEYRKDRFSVSDSATGISAETFFKYLLIPSISTKKISGSTSYMQVESKFFKTNAEIHQLYILVGEIAVYTKEIQSKYDVVIALRSDTQVPVSRDDILYSNKDVYNHLIEEITELLKLSLTDPDYPTVLLLALEAYGKKELTNYALDFYQKSNYYIVPTQYFNIYRSFIKTNIINKAGYLSLNNENRILDNFTFSNKIFPNRYIAIIPDQDFNPDINDATTAGSSKLLFVRKSYTMNPNWAQSLIISRPEYNLSVSASTLENTIAGLRKYYNIGDYLYVNFFRFGSANNGVVNSFLVSALSDMKPFYQISYGGGQSLILSHPKGSTLQISNINFLMEIYQKQFNLIRNKKGDLITFLQYHEQKTIFKTATEELFNVSIIESLKNSDAWKRIPIESRIAFWNNHLKSRINEELLYRHLVDVNVDRKFDLIFLKPAELFIKYTTNISIPEYFQDKPKEYFFSFKLSDLFEYTFINDLNSTNFFEKMEDIDAFAKTTRPIFPLQAMEIAINEGTTRNFITATIMETFQNSVDAIRQKYTKINASSIEIHLEKVSNIELFYSIRDYIGIPSAGLLAISVPFLSTKTAGDASVTGEMGSGFFNIYRESSVVNIKTGINGYTLIFTDTPIKNGKRVVDVQRRVTLLQEPFEGTEISCIFNSDIENDMIEINSLINSVLPLSRPFYFNNKLKAINKQIFVDTDIYEIYRLDEKFHSYVMTNGIPFQKVADYFVEPVIVNELYYGYAINIKPGKYIPSQSRTKIQEISDNTKNRLLELIFYASLYNQLDDLKLWIIPNINSRQDIDQLKFSLGNYYSEIHIQNFCLYYKFNNKLPTIAEIINDIITQYEQGKPIDLKNIKLPAGLPEIIETIIRTWFSNKRLPPKVILATSDSDSDSAPASAPKAPEYQFKKKTKNALTKTDKFFMEFGNCFWKIFKSINIPELKNAPVNPPQVLISSLQLGTFGVYIKEQGKDILNNPNIPQDFKDLKHTIILNKTKINEVKKGALDYINTDGYAMCGIRIPATTLIHELLHAARSESHTESAHSGINLTINGVKKFYEFEDAANLLYELVLANGFLHKLDSALL